jgi:hypothetical protein
VDSDLVTDKHPDAVAQFMAAFVQELKKAQVRRRLDGPPWSRRP